MNCSALAQSLPTPVRGQFTSRSPSLRASSKMAAAPKKMRLTPSAALGVAVKDVATAPIEGQKTGTSGLRKKAAVFSEGNYLSLIHI